MLQEKDMTLPKGYKSKSPISPPAAPSSSPSSSQPPAKRPRQQRVNKGRAILSLVSFIIMLFIMYNLYIDYIEDKKELDELKQQYEKDKAAYERELRNTLGYVPR